MGNGREVERFFRRTTGALRNFRWFARDFSQKRALVFVCYRHDDSAWATNSLVQELRNHFEVFQDTKSNRSVFFREQIGAALDRCDFFLALIAEKWLTIEKDGNRRIDQSTDDVRIEIETALARKLPILLILVGETSRPTVAHLPESLHALGGLATSRLRYEEEADLKIIVDRIKRERHYKPSLIRILLPFVAVGLVLSYSYFWHLFVPRAIETTGMDALKTYLESYRSKTTQQNHTYIPHEQATPRTPEDWVKPDPEQGMLSFFGLYSIFDEVKSIRIVDPRDNSSRSIDLLQKDESPNRVDPNFLRDIRPTNLGGVPVPLGSGPITVELYFKDQRHPETQQVNMANSGIGCVNLPCTSTTGSGKAPLLYAGFEPVNQDVVFLPIAPNGTIKILYAFKNGSYQVLEGGDSRIWGIFQRAISHWKPSDTINLLFQNSDGGESGPFAYSLAGIQEMVRGSFKQKVLQQWREMIQCKRVSFKFPVPATHDEAEFSVKRKLISAGLGFIEQAPVLACIPSPAGWSGNSYGSFGSLWSAVREVRLGPEPSHLPYSAIPGLNVQTFIETPRIIVDANWKVLMPADLQSVYVQFAFFDGGTTEPKSIPIEEINP
jgi:TIR domain